MTRRTQRVGEALREVLSELIQRNVKDPRIGFVTITAVRVTADLSKADVYYTVLDPEQREDTQAGLDSASPYLRTEAGRQVRLKTLPALRFHLDDAPDHGARIDELLREVRPPEPDIDPDEELLLLLDDDDDEEAE
jgi:ribosome-binding factor A